MNKTKTITLISGNEEGFSWRVRIAVQVNGTFMDRGAHFNIFENVYDRNYYKEHKKEKAEYYRNYYEENKELHKARCKNWCDGHEEEIKEYNRNYYEENKEKINEQHRNWSKEHKEYRKAHPEDKEKRKYRDKEYRKSLAGKESAQKHHSKRRSLGFIPLNKPFEGSEGHHINEKEIIYIPKEMHRSITHNVWTGQGMDEINYLALNYLLTFCFITL